MSVDDGDENTPPPGNGAPPPEQPPGQATVLWAKAPTEDVYEAMWRAFRDGARSKKALAEAVGVERRVTRTAIERGWPDKGWASLRSRLEMWSKQVAAGRHRQEIAEAIQTGRTTAQAWRAFADKTMDVAIATADSLGVLSKKVRQACEAATFIRYRKVRTVMKGPDGKDQVVITDQAFVDAVSVFKAIALMSGAAKESAAAMAFLVGSGRLEGTDAPELTPEQIAQIERGEMPDDLNVQMLAKAMLAGTLTLKAGGGTDP